MTDKLRVKCYFRTTASVCKSHSFNLKGELEANTWPARSCSMQRKAMRSVQSHSQLAPYDDKLQRSSSAMLPTKFVVDE